MNLGLYAKIVVNNLQADVKMLNGVLMFVETAKETEHFITKALNEPEQILNVLVLLIVKL